MGTFEIDGEDAPLGAATFDHYWKIVAPPAAKGLCLFCEEPLHSGTRSKEHVLPRWLLREFGVEDSMIEPTWMDARNKFKPRNQRRQVASSLVHGHVCGSCNNGWMSALEVAVTSTLLDLARGRNTVDQLDPTQRVTLARWAVKTAAVLNRSSNFYDMVTQPQAASAMTERLGPGIVVVGRQLTSDPPTPLTWNQTPGIGQIMKPPATSDDDLRAQIESAWRIVLGVGRLLLLVAFMPPSTDWQFCYEQTMHQPIWPLDGVWPLYDAMGIYTPEDFSEVFATTMSLRVISTTDDSTPTGMIVETIVIDDTGPPPAPLGSSR